MLDPKQGADLSYKLQVDDYRSRYEGMRSLEWKVVFQVYGGYAAIAAAFYTLFDKYPHSPDAFRIISIIGTLCFFGANQYLYYRIEERLMVFGRTLEYFIKKAHPSTDDAPQGLGLDAVGHQYFWTYDSQLFINTLTVVGLLTFEATYQLAAWGPSVRSWFTLALCISVAVSVSARLLGRRRYRRLLNILKNALNNRADTAASHN